MNIKDCYPMRKRRSLDKTPGRSTSNYDGRLRTPRRITSPHYLSEQSLDVVWDNNSPSPSRTLMLGKRKKHVGSDSSSSGGEISDLVKKLAQKTGQTPTNNAGSLLNFWLEEEVSHPDTSSNKNEGEKVKSTKKKNQLKTPCRRPRELRKSRRNKNKLSKELEVLASIMQDTENLGCDTRLLTSINKTSSTIVLKPINPDNKTFQPRCINSKDKQPADTRPTSTSTEITSPLPLVDDFGRIDWEDDEEGDVILSQVDISALCNDHREDQVYTSTQLFNVLEHSSRTSDSKSKKELKDNSNIDSIKDSFATENWDFDDDLVDEDNLLQTLDEVERMQIIRNIPSTSKTNKCKEQNNGINMKNPKVEPCKTTSLCTKAEIEKKKLEAQQKLKQKKLKQKSLRKPNVNRLRRM